MQQRRKQCQSDKSVVPLAQATSVAASAHAFPRPLSNTGGDKDEGDHATTAGGVTKALAPRAQIDYTFRGVPPPEARKLFHTPKKRETEILPVLVHRGHGAVW